MTEPLIRVAIFLAVFGAMALWEVIEPWRETPRGRGIRWPAHLGLFLVDVALVRLIFPASAIGFATFAEMEGIGVFHWFGWPGWLAGIAGFVLLDLAIYAQHRVFHRVPWLWRLHRMHHSDTELDVTSGFRFHPLEILLSMLIKGAVIVALGVPATAVLIFEIVLNATSLFNHANIRLPAGVERGLRWLVVTPGMHRTHHSVLPAETDTNYGFNLPWWDRLFGTYTAEPRAGADGLTLGLESFRDPAEQRLDRLLTQPFRTREKNLFTSGPESP